MILTNQIQFASTANNTAYGPTGTVTAAAGDLILVAIAAFREGAAGIAAVSVTNTGTEALRWGQIATVLGSGGISLSLYGATPAVAFTGTVSVAFPGPDNRRQCVIAVDVVSSVSRLAPVNLANVTTGQSTGTSATATLGTLAASDAVHYCVLVHAKQEGTTPGSGFTELADFGLTEAVGDLRIQTSSKVNDATCDPSWATSSPYLYAAAELQAAVITTPPDQQDVYQPVWLLEVTRA